MDFERYEEFRTALKKSLECVIAPFGKLTVEVAEQEPDFDAGQRFFVYSMFPYPGAICLDLSLPLKKMFVEGCFQKKWKDLDPALIDDVFLELTGMLGGHFISQIFPCDFPLRFSPPEILFNEFEDDMDAFLGDMVDFDFLIEKHPVSIIISELKRENIVFSQK